MGGETLTRLELTVGQAGTSRIIGLWPFAIFAYISGKCYFLAVTFNVMYIP